MKRTLITLDCIKDIIIKDLNQSQSVNYSLLGGHFGEIIFLYLYSELQPDMTIVADTFLDKMFSSLKRSPYTGSYCNGFAGLGVGLNYLEQNKFIEGVNETMSDLDLFLGFCLDNNLNNNNFDFLHGFIGIGFYFVMRYPGNRNFCQKQLFKILDHLKTRAIRENTSIKWRSNDPDQTINISLSHGISSCIMLLTDMHSLDFDRKTKCEIKELIDGATAYLLTQQIDPEKYGSCFPSFSLETEKPPQKSRLAWCYGDLGIALSLWKAGTVFSDKELQSKALRIFKFAATHRTVPLQNAVVDAELCHGSSGIASIFQHMYRKTNDSAFLQSYEYWKSLSFSFEHIRESSPGDYFPTYDPMTRNWKNRKNLLDGIAGIGLFFLSTVTQKWDWCQFLLLK